MEDAATNVSFIGLVFVALMGVMVLFVKRRMTPLPLIMTACFVTFGQVVGVGPLHFYMIRIIIFLGFLRIIIRKELSEVKFNSVDKIIFLYVFTQGTIYFLLRIDTEAFINSMGFVYNALGIYLIFRSVIYEENDYYTVFKFLAIVMVPLALSMTIEKFTARNFFSIFGGVPEYTMIREGKLRCQGAFMHPILAGTFGASSIPMFVALWVKEKEKRYISFLGIISGTIITIASASSGPIMVYGGVILGLFMWKFNDNMRMVRWITVISILSLHIVMKAPVWALIGRVSEIVGGGGWHRVMLIDAAISHFSEWWLLGTDYTRHWMPTGVSWSGKHTDITNEFIGVGIKGGLISLILFIAIIIFGFKTIGIKIKEIDPSDFPKRFMVWCLGVSLFSHMMAFISICYFDQIIVFWYLSLALIAGLVKNNLIKNNEFLI